MPRSKSTSRKVPNWLVDWVPLPMRPPVRYERAQRFRSAALAVVDEAYTFAHFLMRNQADAEAAVQECYLRAQDTLDSRHSRATKPELLALLRSICHEKLARRRRDETSTGLAYAEPPARAVMRPRTAALSRSTRPDREESAVIRRLIFTLPMPLLETIVLREYSAMPYREIAEVTRVSIETVMSRLAQARTMLLVAWKTTDR